MKNKLFILLVLFVSVLSASLVVYASDSEGEVGESSSVSMADVNELNNLIDYYYNDSVYTKHTKMYVDSRKIEGDLLGEYFHAKVDTTERTTYYSGDSLWMSRGNGSYSYYGTSYDEEGNPNGVTNGTAYEPLVKPENTHIALRGEGKNSMDQYYVTLSDLYATEDQNWFVDEAGVYLCEDEQVLDNFRNFVAPLWLATETSKNYLDISKATIEVINNELVLKLWVSAYEAEGKLIEDATIDGNHALFSIATINEPYIIKNIHTDMPTYTEGGVSWPIENMFDGNIETFTWFADHPTPDSGKEVIIELSKEIMLTDFTIYQTSGRETGSGSADMMAANILVSTDGVEYTPLESRNVDEKGRDIHYSKYTYINVENPVATKYIKLVDLDAGGWVCIREILINQAPSVQLQQFSVSSHDLSKAFDGDESTFVHLNTNGTQNECAFIVDYAEVKSFNTIRVMTALTGGDCLHGFKLSYSVDGEIYYDITEVSVGHANVRNYTHQLATPIEARYIKVEGVMQYTNWVELYEFSAR